MSQPSISRAAFLSHFTPTLMTPEALEAILVERDELANELVERVLTSIQSGTKGQTLLVGPRGIGKTHLVALTYYRVKARLKESPEINGKVCIAWLREDEYGVVSWLDLLIRLFRALEEEHPGTTTRAELDALFTMPTAEAERQAQKLLLDYLNGRTLWLLVENLNAIFEDMKESGQRKWRAFWQEHPVFTTLATSPTLFKGISSRTAPFYGFFAIESLAPLDTEGAAHLLGRIAQFRGDIELADFLETPVGRARVRAVHHLAGGNFRVYVVFAAFLSRQSLDELVPPILQLLDELTPYYQSHLTLLSGQQRKIVEVLCDYRGAMPVKDLATRGFMTSQTASSQLADLKERGYVVAHTWGRESFYELREPLMRLCLEVKKHRGGPIAIFVEFLRLWHSRNELRGRLEICPPEFPFERESLALALAQAELDDVDPHISATLTDFGRALNRDEYAEALLIVNDLVQIRGEAWDWGRMGYCLLSLGRFEDATKALSRAIEIESGEAYFWHLRAIAFLDQEFYEKSVSDALQALSMEESLGTHFTLGMSYSGMEKYEKAILHLNKVLKKNPRNEDALIYKGIAQNQLSLYDKSIKIWKKLEKMGVDDSRVLLGLSDSLLETNKFAEAVNYLKRLVDEFPEIGSLNYRLSTASILSQNFELALVASSRVFEIGVNSDYFPYIDLDHAQALIGLKRWDEGMAELKIIFGRVADSINQLDGYAAWLVRSIFYIFDPKISDDFVLKRYKDICDLFQSVGYLDELSGALLIHAIDLVKECCSERNSLTAPQGDFSFAEKALSWTSVWARASVGLPIVHNATQWIEKAIQIASSGRPRQLLNLPSEERQIVFEVLEEGGYFDSFGSETPRKEAANALRRSRSPFEE